MSAFDPENSNNLEKDDIENLRILKNHLIENVYPNFLMEQGYTSTQVKLNVYKLMFSVGNAYVDMRRMTGFHMPDSSADRHKYAGFLSKWIAKNRPLDFVIKGMNNQTPKLYKVNAQFAVYVMEFFLEKRMPRAHELIKNLEYIFEFRDEKGETLSLISYLCEEKSRLEGG